VFDDPRWGDDPRDRDEDPRDRHARGRDRDDDAGPHLGRGPSSRYEKSEPAPRDRDDARRPERDRDSRGHDPRDRDPRDAFMRGLNLPRGREREMVHDPRERAYTLRGSETRTLSTVGAFRVVQARDLRDYAGREADPRSGDLRHLREQGLISTVRLDGRRDVAIVLTDRGRDLLESHRGRDQDARQEFYAGLKRERELEHDAQVYAAYLSAAERLDARGAHIERVLLDYELKRDYQQWLHERDREHEGYDGHPDRDAREIEDWALEHHLPYFDEQVHFPDLRIEYLDIDGRRERENVEVLTIHYRGAHGAAAARSGFTAYRGFSARIGGGNSGGRRGGGHNGGLAEEVLR
jgi:DNA-binding MarR family transcriptional regulator